MSKPPDRANQEDVLFQGVLESAPDAMLVVDKEGAILIANAQTEAIFGHTRDRLIGESIELLVPERFRAAHPAMRAEYHAAPRVRPMGLAKDLFALRADGTEFPVEISLSPIETAQGTLVVTAIRDVTVRREMEAALRASEKMHRTLAEAAPVGVFQTDPEGRCTYINERWTRITGLEFDAAKGDGWCRAIHGADFDHVVSAWNEATEKGETYRCECRFVLRDGTTTWVYGQAVPIKDDAGKVEGFVGTITDITDRKKAEEALRERERRFRAIFDQEFQFVGLLAVDGTVLEVNQSALDSVHADADEVIGVPFWETRFWSSSEQTRRRVQAAVRTAANGEFVRFETEFPTADGDVAHVDFSLKPVRDEKGHVEFLLPEGRDISRSVAQREELRKLATDLASLNTELARSNQDLDDFAYIASHDLKEPLRGISNYAAFLVEDYAGKFDAEADRMLATIRKLCERMEALIEGLLQYSRVGNSELGVDQVDIGELVHNVLEGLPALLDEHEVEIVVAESLPTLDCDRVRIGEVFHNLITNAIKYNEKTDKRVEVGCQPIDGGFEFSVRDNGIGIDPHHLESVFGMFKRLHGRDEFGGGTGAGLTITRKIVERHGGTLRIESEPGAGSTFYFTLMTS